MKEFKRQLKMILEEKRSITLAEEWAMKKFWRAALEWILICDTGPEADELIEKELEDENT